MRGTRIRRHEGEYWEEVRKRPQRYVPICTDHFSKAQKNGENIKWLR